MTRENLREQERTNEINAICEELNKRDKNWSWEIPVIEKHGITMLWEYLKEIEEPYPYFRLRWSEEAERFIVKVGDQEDITEELEDTTDLRSAMFSVFGYANSRYWKGDLECTERRIGQIW